jgi:hypothetical protein
MIPGIIPAEFEFCSKFHQKCFINLAGAWAKIYSSGIPGMAWIPPDSARFQQESVGDSKDLLILDHF